MSRFGCAAVGCEAHPSDGVSCITRISPIGEPFEGLCAEHLGRSTLLDTPAPVQANADIAAATPPAGAQAEAITKRAGVTHER